jgi:thiamine-phosphate pyrophosphorylase
VHSSPLIYLITSRNAVSQIPEKYAPLTSSTPLLNSLPLQWQRQILAISLAAEAGCQLIQIRERDLPARDLLRFVQAAVSIAHSYKTKVLVNERMDIALAAGADGVHLRTSSFSAREARKISRRFGMTDFLVSVSTHSMEEAVSAESAGADLVLFGPVWEPLSKKSVMAPAGLIKLQQVAAAVRIPVLALGGVERENYADALRQGAAGIAAISLFAEINSVVENVRSILYC